MRTFLSFSALVALAAVGCNNSPQGGGPEGSKETFTFSPPTMSQSVKQGDTETVDINVDRGANFGSKISFKAEPPKGVNVKFQPETLNPADPGKTAATISVDKDAPLGDYKIRITATPEKGTATSQEMKLNVEKR